MAKQPFTQTVQARMTDEQEGKLIGIGIKNRSKRSDLVNMDGTINLSAVVRLLIDTAKI